MPINNTKYNIVTNLQENLNCGNSGLNRSYFFTLDASDNYVDNQQYRVYLTSKASHLIHPFSQVSNCRSQITNANSLFRIRIPQKVHIDPSNVIQRQKQIQNVVGVQSSNYTMNLASLHTNSEDLSNNNRGIYNASDRLQPHGLRYKTASSSSLPNYGIDVKHNSYDRYLARKKSQYLKSDINPEVPRAFTNYPTFYGNKTMKFGLVHSNTCRNC